MDSQRRAAGLGFPPQLGATPVTRSTSLAPVLILAVIDAVFLTDIPTAGNDIPLDLIAITAGVLSGSPRPG